ncbi:MAG TPA: class III extradiol ring-cleavage dioxygenase [Thermoanaerobaculia bacterium]|jgi:4,5-DOPA dioxygenase extradiol
MSIVSDAPTLFVSHGSPMFAIDAGEYGEALRRFGERVPRPAAIVIVSAHWEAPWPIRVIAAARPPLIYDFGGFPKPLYELQYPAPGSPPLAAEVVRLLSEAGLPAEPDPTRGWDHGVWIPLRLIYPAASVPVVEVSLPVPRKPQTVLEMGTALAPLKRRGILLIGSGGIVHNLGLARLDRPEGPVDGWAQKFDEWVRERVGRRDIEEIVRYRKRAPHARLAVPASEHFDPLFFVLGAAEQSDAMEQLSSGFRYSNLSLTSFAFVPNGAR